MAIRLNDLLIALLLLLPPDGLATEAKATQCPSYCTCDLFENLNRADCSGQRLITPNVELPIAVELLDLSYNDITTLDNACFQGFVYIVNLTIAHNALHTIYLDAFGPLKSVRFIDLSYNRLEYFDEQIFERNQKLTRLELSGNRFSSLQNKPILRSTSLRYLGLHDSQITYIYPLMFSEVPNLREIDVSNNLMITVGTTAFNTLHQLEMVRLDENRWNCDDGFEMTLQYLRNHDVDIKLNTCIKKPKLDVDSSAAEMFERMIQVPKEPMEVEERRPMSVDNIWKPMKPFDGDELDGEISCDQADPAKVCQLFRNCIRVTRTFVESKKTSDENQKCGEYTENDLKFVYFTGISLGFAFFTCLVACGMCAKRCLTVKKSMETEYNNGTREANSIVFQSAIPARAPSQIQRIATPPMAPPPVPLRQRRSNRRPRNPPPLNRSLSSPARRGPPATNQGDFATFLSRLFERPSRHQYYRTINENTAYMIRRLSQSNLFNNRLSQHFTGGGSRNTNTENVQQEEPLIHQPPQDSPASAPQVHRSAEERWRAAAHESIRRPQSSVPRPETPPPAYVDIIKPNDD